MKDFRIVQNGNRLDYSCENHRFRTNINKGKPHRTSATGGSVFDNALIADGSSSLWLEHAFDKQDNRECYWLMWYDNGKPTIPLSGVFERADIEQMVGRLAREFLP